MNRLKRARLDRRYKRGLPNNYSIEDVFLVSFPKSGNTWLRFLIANAIALHYQVNREVNFFTIQDIIPGIKGTRDIRDRGILGLTDLPRVIKSHAAYNPHYQRVILLVRNPEDVMVSSYYYRQSYKNISESMTISEFIRDQKYGIKAWSRHTKSWCLTYKIGQIIRVFRYEDLLAKPQQQLDLIMNLLGINVTEKVLEEALRLSSKDMMSKSEFKHRSNYLLQTQTTPFVNFKNRSNTVLTKEDRQCIAKQTKELSSLIKYEN